MQSSETIINKSQRTILSKIQKYLTYNGRILEGTDLTVGHCSGITILWLYCQWLSNQLKKEGKEDNMEVDGSVWFETTRDLILGWDANEYEANKNDEKHKNQLKNIERFISLIRFFQHPEFLLPTSRQNDLSTIVQDTTGRKLEKKYSIASIFSQEELEVLLPKIIKKDTLIYISSFSPRTKKAHATGLFQKSDGTICYLDPNEESGELSFTISKDKQQKSADYKKLAAHIYANHHLASSPETGLSFQMFSFDSSLSDPYPSQTELLTEVNNYKRGDILQKNNPLITAVINDSLESVKYYKDTYINTTDISGMTALMFAANRRSLTIAQLLLNSGANINMKDANKQTALMFAVLEGDLEITRLLLNSGADINAEDKNGWTALMTAADEGNLEIIELLLKQPSASAAYINAKNIEGQTALMFAVDDGNLKIVQELLKNHANPNIKNNNEITALMIAASKGNWEIVNALLKAGADLNIQSKDGWTALMYAAKAGHEKIVQTLQKPPSNILSR